MTNNRHDIKDVSLADQGRERIDWALTEMPVFNLAAAEGHPATVMDMSFANQALSIAYLWEQR
ncbi:MAG: hypothetical protein Q7U18_09140 [Methylobacter sp.]|nr:hypothetical protein [Methylobacter sp.]